MKKKNCFITFAILSFLLPFMADASIQKINKKIKYRTYFGKCPSRVVGEMALQLVKVFEQEASLKSIKEKILEDNLKERYYLSSYKIDYNPVTKLLNLSFDCPTPLMKAQIYKGNGVKFYNAILVDNGQLFDPNYEMLLRSEKILKNSLPSLALPVGDLDKKNQEKVAKLIKKLDLNLRKNLSEVIISEENDLTIIFSIKNRASNAFFGKNNWIEKSKKLKKIIDYMDKKDKIPAIINLTNEKKIVVKFSDKF
ncbi:MAG: hypothetical protein OXB88_09265 [Bacteriovoracales bacterium]|nr:hypothetical protein [Bacteriovoracales bacterium]